MTKINYARAYRLKEKLVREERIIPATFDPIFKSIMKECPNYFSTIISEVTGIDKEYILTNLVFQDTEFIISNYLEKRKRSDLIVEVGKNLINIEMNKEYYKGLLEKNEAYMRKIGSDICYVGEEYDESRKIIQINFDNFTLYDDERVVIKFQIMDKERGIVEIESYEKYHINLEKVREKYYNKEELNKLEKCLLLLTLENLNDLEKLSKGESELMEAEEKIKEKSFDINTIGLYDYEKMKKREDYLKEKYRLELAEEKGIESGMKKGLEKGLEQGSKQSKIEIAKKMFVDGESIEKIEKYTGLSKEEISLL